MKMEKSLTREETKEKALRLLEFRSHSEYELKQKLLRAGAEAADIESAVEFLNAYGFLDDQKYAKAKAKELAALKKFGKKRIAADLRNRGIDAEIIDAAVSELEHDEFEMLLPLVRKKMRGDFEKKSVDRTLRYCITKGYKFEDIKKCIEIIKDSEY